MKRLLLLLLVLTALADVSAQRYEIWLQTTDNQQVRKKNLGSFNDSVLLVYSRATMITLSKEYKFQWDNVDELKIRNKSRHDIVTLVGFGAGLLASTIIHNSLGDDGEGLFFAVVGAPILLGGGALAGHLLTSARIVIPINGKSPQEKSQALRERIAKH